MANTHTHFIHSLMLSPPNTKNQLLHLSICKHFTHFTWAFAFHRNAKMGTLEHNIWTVAINNKKRLRKVLNATVIAWDSLWTQVLWYCVPNFSHVPMKNYAKGIADAHTVSLYGTPLISTFTRMRQRCKHCHFMRHFSNEQHTYQYSMLNRKFSAQISLPNTK